MASLNVDKVIISSAIIELNGPCPKASSLLGLQDCIWIPKLEDLVRYLGSVLDGNFSSLMLHLKFHEELKCIEALIGSLASEVKFTCSVANVIQTSRVNART
ncbi:unnamed protein product [Dovyalis caffra]|uniref:Uncharacterized protein n=1 Tax=Dovyalis caffra TaxID=77055 RepID=A0AAV1QWD8_9ROSI|nr:unnamed protein product [Dovyalis caffra]